MKNILFSINTEYHVFVVNSLIKQMFHDKETYDVTVLLHVNKAGGRFKAKPLSFEHLQAKVVILEIDLNSKVYDPNISSTLNGLLEIKYDKLVLFLEQAPVNQYLIHKLAPKGTTICVAPEGTKPYISIAKMALPSRIKALVRNYKFFRTQKLKVTKLYMVSNKNGYLKETDEVWINHPDAYENVTGKKVVPIKLYTTKQEAEVASKIFNLEIEKELPETDGILFYLNQWYVEFKVYDFEIELLEKLLAKYPTKKIYIKMHPNTHKFQVERLEKMDRVVLNKSTVPAELFIAHLTNSAVFSFWSASLLIDNPSCKFYWLHKLIQQRKLMDWWSIVNPTKHIYEVVDIDEVNI